MQISTQLPRKMLQSLRDMTQFGLFFPIEYALHWLFSHKMQLRIANFGNVEIRTHESDLDVARQIFVLRSYDIAKFPQEAWVSRQYDALCATGATPIIVDAGANIGASTIWFAAKYPKAQVFAIEPDSANVACCKTNTDHLSNVVVLEAAIGAKPGKVFVENPSGASWGIQTQRADVSCDGVAIVPVSDLIKKVAGGRLFIVKIDIEGFELDLFSENTDWLDEPSLVIIEPHDWMLPGKKSSRGFQRAFAARDFDLLIHTENLLYFKAD